MLYLNEVLVCDSEMGEVSSREVLEILSIMGGWTAVEVDSSVKSKTE